MLLPSNTDISKAQAQNVFDYTQQIIQDLPPKALQELTGGYENDFNLLAGEIHHQVSNTMNFVKSLDTEKLQFLEQLEYSMDVSLKKLSLNYFTSTVLHNFNMGWRNLEWSNLVQLFPKSAYLCERGSGKSFHFCFAFPTWRLYSYDRPSFYTGDSIDNINRKETMLITNESTLGKTHLSKIVEEIKFNDVIAEKLNPRGKASLGKESIETETGSILKLRTFNSSGIRGNHVGSVIVDDFLDKSALYSKEQRSKFKEVFYAEIISIVEPGGYCVVSGCVNPNSIVQTKNGLRRIGSLCPSKDIKTKRVLDYKEDVFGLNSYNKTSKYWCNGLTKTKKIVTKFNFSLECSEIHPLLSLNTKNHTIDWVKSPKLNIGDYVAIKVGSGVGSGNKIKIEEIVNVKAKNRVDHKGYLCSDLAYFIGLWIADGSFDRTKNGFTITKQNKGIRDFILSGFCGTKFKVRNHDPIKMDYGSVDLLNIFNQIKCKIGTAKNKMIPSTILESDEETIVQTLRGMFDGDGSFYQKENGTDINISYSSISENLINDLQIILLHLGIVSATHNQGIGISKKVIGKHELFVLNVIGYDATLFMDKIGFLYSNKGDKYIEPKKNFPYHKYISNTSKLIRGIQKHNYEKLKSRKIKSPIKSNTLSNYRITKDNLKTMYDFFQQYSCDGEDLLKLGEILKHDCVWLPIKSIEDNECYTVDFVIPNDHTFISNGIISHNTPFHEKDLYNDIREDNTFKVFDYPAIYPDGKMLAPDRYTFQNLLDLRVSLGNMVFAREHMVSPITDSASLFPWSDLEHSFVGMENVRLVNSIHEYPTKLKKVVIGCDFAISGKIAADNSVFAVLGVDTNDNYHLLHITKMHGASHNEQVNTIVSLDQRFKPNKIVAEANGFQSILADMVKQKGVKNIEPFTTTSGNKKDLYLGLPSLAAMFQRYQIKFPYAEGTTRDTVEWVCGEFNSVSFNEDNGKLESVGEHDDAPMAIFMAINDLRENTRKFKAYLA